MVTQEVAEEIMDRNFFGPEEAKRHLKIEPTAAQLQKLKEVPFDSATLRKFKDTHVLIAVLPISITDIRRRVRERYFYDREHWWSQEYANDETAIYRNYKSDAAWVLLRKTAAEGSVPRYLYDKRVFLGEDEILPVARVVIYAIIGLYLCRGDRLFEDTYVQTSRLHDHDHDGNVFVGRFDHDGISFHNEWNSYYNVRRSPVGVSCALKPLDLYDLGVYCG